MRNLYWKNLPDFQPNCLAQSLWHINKIRFDWLHGDFWATAQYSIAAFLNVHSDGDIILSNPFRIPKLWEETDIFPIMNKNYNIREHNNWYKMKKDFYNVGLWMNAYRNYPPETLGSTFHTIKEIFETYIIWSFGNCTDEQRYVLINNILEKVK